MQDVLRLAGELSIVRVLNDFQPLPILYNCSGIIQHTGKTEYEVVNKNWPPS
ncbi:hypothetical protein SB359474_1123 [Shigella boydii 3594-74]|nr:hypothetical protein SB359474_1123 [Shigella boydii 3594-74]